MTSVGRCAMAISISQYRILTPDLSFLGWVDDRNIPVIPHLLSAFVFSRNLMIPNSKLLGSHELRSDSAIHQSQQSVITFAAGRKYAQRHLRPVGGTICLDLPLIPAGIALRVVCGLRIASRSSCEKA
jgi:hypothetical protein